MTRKAEPRIACVCFPRLAIERWAKASGAAPDQPVVLIVEGAHGPVIHAASDEAARRGARAGARLVDARALEPALVAVPADPAGDDALVRRLARWAARWSPSVEVDGHSLKLDVTGIAHLFGGQRALLADIVQRFEALGLSARAAIAPTPAAAWALARYSPSPLEGESDSAKQSGVKGYDTLPVAALRLDSGTERTLERLGLKTIGALLDVPRVALARRFRGAQDVVDSLDRLFGSKPEPVAGIAIERRPRASLRLEEPATHPEAAPQALGRLIPDLVKSLEQRRLGARRLTLTGFRVDGSLAEASVATSIASREPGHLQRLLADKVAALDPGFGFDAFALEAEWSEPLAPTQDSLAAEAPGERDVARLVDRLSVKLGPDSVRCPDMRTSHVPERANGWVAAISSSLRAQLVGKGTVPAPAGMVEGPTPNPSTIESTFDGPPPRAKLREELKRPQRLLDRPEAIAVIYATPEGLPRRFVWRRSLHEIARVQGPERIAPEWWRERSTARLRDYYRVEDQAGRRYWIFREGVAGDGRGGAPAWFIHGLFG